MRIIVVLVSRFNALLDWATSHRRYRLIAVSPLTGGWIYLDSSARQICWVQSQLVDAGTPLEISENDALTMLNPDSGLGWEKVTPSGDVWHPDINRLIAAARSELSARGADCSEVA